MSWRRSRSPKWKTTGRAAVDRVCLRRAVDQGLSRGATGNVRMTSRQPPNDSVASHRFRIFRPKESFAPRCASDLLPPVASRTHYRALNSPGYGCDQHFNKLKKKPRVVPQKIRKGHPMPIWLERYM